MMAQPPLLGGGALAGVAQGEEAVAAVIGAAVAMDQQPAVAAEEEVPAFRCCGMPNCNFVSKRGTVPGPNASADTVKKYYLAQATQFAKHANIITGHIGVPPATFLAAHADNAVYPWCTHLRACVACKTVHGKHNWAKHVASAGHKDAAAAEALAAADGAPPPPPFLPPPAGGVTYDWGLQEGSPQRACLDSLTIKTILGHQLLTLKHSAREWREPFAKAYDFVLNGLRTSVSMLPQRAATRSESAAWSKLRHLVPCLLLAPDGKVARAQRFATFASGNWAALLTATLAYVDKVAAAPRTPPTLEHQRQRMTHTARQPGGIARASRATANGFASSSPHSAATLEALQLKHPPGPPAADLAEAVATGSLAAAAELAAQPPTSSRRMSRVFTSKTIRTSVMSTSADVAPGLCGLRILHLQQLARYGCSAVVNSIFKHLAWLAQEAFLHPDNLPDDFWSLFSAARLSAVGEKARPIACGDTVRRIIGRVYCHHNKERFSKYFEAVGQYGVAAQSGAEKMGLTAQLVHEAEGTVVSIDGRNAFNALRREVMLRHLAKHAPDAFAFVSMIYSGQPSLRFSLVGQASAVEVLSQQGVQQGDPLGPLLFAIAMYPIMQSFRQHCRFQHLALPAFLDDLGICCLTSNGLTDDLAALREAYEWLVVQLQQSGIEVNVDKTVCLLPAGAAALAPAAEQHRYREWASEQLGGVKVTTAAGIRLVGVPVGSAQFATDFVAAALRDPSADRQLREIVLCRDTQLSFTLLRLCYLTRGTFLARNVPPSASAAEFKRFDAITVAAVAGVAQEPSATTPSSVQEDGQPDDWASTLAYIRAQHWEGNSPVSFSALQQLQIQLQQASGGMGISSFASRCHAAYVGRTLTVIRGVLAGLPAAQRDVMAPRLLQTASVQGLSLSVAALRGLGVDPQSLEGLIPAELLAWTASPDDPLSVANWSGWLSTDADAQETELPRRLQAALSHAIERTLLADFRSKLAEIDVAETRVRALARHLSQSSKGAAAFLSTIPCFDKHRSMQGAEFREALRRWLDECKPDPGGMCSHDTCTQPHTAVHARRCSRTGEQTFRHDAVKVMVADVLKAVLRLQGVTVEDRMFAEFGCPDLRMDVTAHGNQCKCPSFDEAGIPVNNAALTLARVSNAIMIDVAVVDETGPTYTATTVGHPSSALQAGTAAAHKTKAKFETYRGKYNPSSHTLFAAVLEQSGAGSRQLHLLVKMLAEFESERSDGAFAVSACVQRWRQRLSVTLQRAVSQSESRLLSKVRRPLVPGGDAPVLDRYQRVHLLRRLDLQPAEQLLLA